MTFKFNPATVVAIASSLEDVADVVYSTKDHVTDVLTRATEDELKAVKTLPDAVLLYFAVGVRSYAETFEKMAADGITPPAVDFSDLPAFTTTDLTEEHTEAVRQYLADTGLGYLEGDTQAASAQYLGEQLGDGYTVGQVHPTVH